MTELQKYVVQSLVERGQITAKKFIRALESITDQNYVEVILQELIKEDKVEESMKSNSFPRIILVNPGTNKLHIIKVIKEACDLGLKEAKDLVDEAPSLLPDSDNNEKLFRNLRDFGATVRLLEDKE